MNLKKNFNFLYFFLFLLVLIPQTYAQNILDMVSSSLNVELETLILMVGLFFLLFAILQKAANMIFGNKTTVNLISALLSLTAIVFMPQDLLDFFIPYEILVLAVAVILVPIVFLDLFGMRSKRLKHFFLIVFYVLALVGFSYLFNIPEFNIVFELEIPMFFLGDIILKDLIRWVLWIAIIFSIFIWIKEQKIVSYESRLKRFEEIERRGRILKDTAETRKFLSEIKSKENKKGILEKMTVGSYLTLKKGTSALKKSALILRNKRIEEREKIRKQVEEQAREQEEQKMKELESIRQASIKRAKLRNGRRNY